MTEEHYDPFPINLLESSGYIKREDFTFKTRRVRIYHKQEFTEYRICGKISGVIKDEKMFIKLQDINMPFFLKYNLIDSPIMYISIEYYIQLNIKSHTNVVFR